MSSETAGDFGYEVDRSTFDYLRETNIGIPRLLVVIRLPKHPLLPLAQDAHRTLLRNAPFWLRAKGEPALRAGQDSKVLRIRKTQVFTPDSLRHILEQRARLLI